MKNKKILFLLIIVIFLLLDAILVISSSKEYVLYVRDRQGEYLSCSMKMDKEGIAELKSYEHDGDYIVLRLKAVGSGTTDADIYYYDENEEAVRIDVDVVLTVNGLGMLLYRNSEINGWYIGMLGETFLFIFIAVYFGICFFECKKKNLYSFSSIMNLGFVIMFAGLGLIYSVLSVYLLFNFRDYTTDTAFLLTENMMNLMVLASVVPVVIFGIFMIATNISLIRHEAFRIVNLLGIIISLTLMIGIVSTLYLRLSVYSMAVNTVFIFVLQFVISSIFCFFECMLAASAICCFYSAKRRPAYDSDYVIILGCRIRRDGNLTPLLKGRADGAIAYYNKRLEKYGKKTYLVPSGGKGGDEIMAEGDAIARYLLEKGIPEEQIITENRSANTYENMAFSKKLMALNNPDEKVYYSTTGYHVFRSGILAANAGLNAQGIGCSTKLYFWPNAFVREFIGMFVQLKKRLLPVIGIITMISLMIAVFLSARI